MLTLYYHVTITISLFFWVPLRAVRVFCHPHLTAPFTSDLGVPPGRLGGSVRCPPPSLLPGVLNLQGVQTLSVFSHPFPTTPFTSDLGVPPGCLGGVLTFIFVGLPRFVFGGNALYTFPNQIRSNSQLSRLDVLGSLLQDSPSAWGEPRLDAFGTGVRVAVSISSGPVLLPLVGNRVGWRRGRRGRAGVAGLSFIGSWLWSDAPYARFVVVVELPDSPRFRAGGPYNVAPYLFLRRRPLTTLGHLPPTAVAESQWGEPRSDASGTSVRVAGSISLWPVLLPIVGEEEGGVGQEWQAFSSLSLGRGAMVSIFPPPDSPRLRVGGPWSAAPYLFLRRRPLTTLGRPPPTAVAESQWGEPRSDAFGTGARVAVSISLWPVLLPIVGNRKEKETTEAYLSEDIVTVVACLLQCLQILCIINEFKAAAITYGLDKKSRSEYLIDPLPRSLPLRSIHPNDVYHCASCEEETLATEGKVRVYEAGTAKAARQNQAVILPSISVREPASTLQRIMCTVLRRRTGGENGLEDDGAVAQLT
ncbi:hypothetical protein EDB85DRAFT_2165319 [Lactarius pseudohatsudake]|nr:hypothetical protein EDB85DRAFT_2165319 [Lactarius pseudohatsudake]